MHKTYRYTPKTGHLLDATEGNSVVTALYAPSGNAAGATTSLHGSKALSTRRLYSLAGRLQQELRGDGSCWTYSYATSGNEVGLPTQMTDGKTVKVVFGYDGLNRVAQTVATALQSRHVLKTDIKRDAFGREVKRTFNSNAQDARILLQEYDVVGRVVRRTLHKGNHQGEVLTDEQFTYDLRSRLSDYRVSGNLLPKDAYGNAIVRQTFMADALDNITVCVTTLQTGESNTATHHYKNAKDPCQLSYVTNTLTSRGYPSKVPLLYDGAGRLVRDEVGRTLRYDALGRLSRVESAKYGSGDYGYDAFDRLAWQQGDDTRLLHRLYYDNSTLTNEWVGAPGQNQQADTVIRYLGTVAQTMLESRGEETLLLGTDQKQSVMAVCRETLTDQTYTPYGLNRPSDSAKSRAVKGYNGERCDPITGTTHLGNGYRAYNPVLMRFHCPDSWSPFGKGGLNPYAYCGGDPVNHADPSGHVNWWSVGFGIFGIVAGLALIPFTGGASLVLVVTITASAVISSTLDIASGVLEDSHPELSRNLGIAAVVIGIPAMVDGVHGLYRMGRVGVTLVREAPTLLRQANELYNGGVKNLLKANRLAMTNTPTQITTWGRNIRNAQVIGITESIGSAGAHDLPFGAPHNHINLPGRDDNCAFCTLGHILNKSSTEISAITGYQEGLVSHNQISEMMLRTRLSRTGSSHDIRNDLEMSEYLSKNAARDHYAVALFNKTKVGYQQGSYPQGCCYPQGNYHVVHGYNAGGQFILYDAQQVRTIPWREATQHYPFVVWRAPAEEIGDLLQK
uniref:RHS repeat-associated core domain-containing protein n=1 Tax=Photorhabdus sp. RM322S TaxID=3342825 RepID=UPI0036DDDA81